MKRWVTLYQPLNVIDGAFYYREGKFLRSRGNQLEREWCVSRYLQMRGLKDMEVAISDLKVGNDSA